jgi:ribosomal protein L37AE/L43A
MLKRVSCPNCFTENHFHSRTGVVICVKCRVKIGVGVPENTRTEEGTRIVKAGGNNDEKAAV